MSLSRQSIRFGAAVALATGAVAVGAFAAGCSDDSPTPATASPTSVPSAATTIAAETTPTPKPIINPNVEAGGANGFQSFAAKVQASLAAGDSSLITGRLQPRDERCTAADVAQPVPGCKSAGDNVQVVPSGRWKSEGELVSPAQAKDELARFVSSANASAKDGYGSGAARVYAVSAKGDVPAIVITAISPVNGQPVRQGLLLRLSFVDGRWMVSSYLTASVLVEDWLAPNADARAILPYWQKFES